MAEPVRRHRQPVRRGANAPASRRRADPASPRGVKPSAADALRLARHFALIAKAPAMRRFLEEDAAAALRILTMRDGLVQGRLVRKHAELLREEAARGAYTPRVDPGVLAYAIVRIGEAFLYNDAIIALEPNVEQARAVVRLLLD